MHRIVGVCIRATIKADSIVNSNRWSHNETGLSWIAL